MTFPPYEPEPEQKLTGDLMGLMQAWEEIGVDADDFLKCGACHRWIRDLVSPWDETTADGTFLPGIPDSDCCTCPEETA